MSEQTIYNPVLLISARILENLTFLISGIGDQTLGDLTKFGKVFVSKYYHSEEKMKSSFQTWYNCDWIKFSYYSCDKEFRKISGQYLKR